MRNIDSINWQTFISLLQKYPNLHLQFQYTADKLVDASYHITEIKQAPIVSVDCGGVMNSWTEIIVQLWEPEQGDSGREMKVSKALSIIDIVEKALPLNPLGTVKIEFGNSQFDTRQMFPGEFILSGDNLIVNLSPDFVQCKAIERGSNCGTNDKGEECCTPALEIKPEKMKMELVSLGVANSCAPGSGCC